MSWGNGVYKSTDGGRTWRHMGLRDSRHIGRIVIHPTNPDIVYVAALGHFWGPNKERGLYKTTDGGQTWTNTKFLSEDCGFVDVVIDRDQPDTLYAAAYQVRRDAFSGGDPAVQFGPDAGIYKTTDGGQTWRKLTKGLPTRPMGRIGLTLFHRNQKILFAVIQTDRTNIRTVAGQPAKPAGANIETGGIFRSDDGGESWIKVNDLCPRPFYYGKLRIDPNDLNRIYVLGVSLFVSDDGGKTFRSTGAPRVHPDHHALWINPQNSDHLILGNDGGLYFSYDRGANWEHVNNLPIAQFYAIGVDLRQPYWVYGGLQDNGSWGAPSATRSAQGIAATDWVRVGGGDGFYCQVDPTDPNILYVESQYGRPIRHNLATGQTVSIAPRPPQGAKPYRFNWNTPMLLSPHNPSILYYGGNFLFRSLNRGDRWETISPDLTRGQRGSLTTIAESPLVPGLLWTGSDDGKVFLTRNGGTTWTDLSEKIPAVSPERHISRIEASHHDPGTAYLTIDRHRNDDYRPYVFKTTDYGATWRPLTANLPAEGSVHVIREDRKNKNLLFLGTEFGLFVSLNGGESWERLRPRLLGTLRGADQRFPTVAVHDLVIHPRDDELVIATHGRGIYIMDVAPLQQMTPEVLKATAHLFDPKPAQLRSTRVSSSSSGAKPFFAPNPPAGATIYYCLKDKSDQPVRIGITDPLGKPIVELTGPREPGLHAVQWNLRYPGRGGMGRFTLGPQVTPGDYLVKITVGETTVTKKLRVEADE